MGAPDDPSIDVATAIAIAAQEELVIIEVYEGAADDPRIRKLAADTGLTIKRVAASKVPSSDPTAFLRGLHQLQERLVVMTRGVLEHEAALMLVSARRVPVLVIEPPEPMGGDALPQPQTTD